MSKRKRARTGPPLPTIGGDWLTPIVAVSALALAIIALAVAQSNQGGLNRLEDRLDALPTVEVGGGAIEITAPKPGPRVR